MKNYYLQSVCKKYEGPLRCSGSGIIGDFIARTNVDSDDLWIFN
jgi:hypothetical protein